MNWDREYMSDEDREECECIKSAAHEREIDRGDYLRDEMLDRQMEERESARLKEEQSVLCNWYEDADGVWGTHCGERFTFAHSSPHDNGMMFCGFCGRRLIERKFNNTFPVPSGIEETDPVGMCPADLSTLSEGLRQEAAGSDNLTTGEP